MNFEIIVTFGPSIRDEEKLKNIAELGDCIFRINGAHTTPNQVTIISEFIKNSLPDAKIMMDLPGNKIRLQNLSYPLPIEKGKGFKVYSEQFNFPSYYKYLNEGDLIATHDSTYTLEVIESTEKHIQFLSHHTGTLLPNKGMHSPGVNRNLPFLFEKDSQLIDAAIEAPIDYLSLSFVRTADDIQGVKAILKQKKAELKLISKIETAQAIENLGDIFFEVDMINVDRGDLSADIGILKLPLVQDRIIESAKRAKKEVFLATQFLSNMEKHQVPLISEIADLYKTIKLGISGIQLSEETAVGSYPVECVKMVFDMYRKSFASD